MELWLQFLGISGELFRLADDLSQAAAPALHELHAVEQIGDHRIVAHGTHRVDVAVLE